MTTAFPPGATGYDGNGSVTSSTSALTAEADRALAAGDVPRAIDFLGQAVTADPGNGSLHLRLAALHRAAGQPHKALAAATAALAASPLDFVALAMRANLLESVDPAKAPEAWAYALAQQPREPLPAALSAAVERRAALRDAWIAECDRAIGDSISGIVTRADQDERRRINRFRSNALRRTRHFHSEPTHYHFSGLVEREFHGRQSFPFLDQLEAATGLIRDELQAVMTAERTELVPYIQYESHLPMQQWSQLNHSRDWTAIHLWRNGKRIDANARHCPATLALLDGFGQPHIPGASPNAMFSLLAPGTAIPPHVGISNARLVCHLPLMVPPTCWFRVGAETRAWEEGRAFVFDDTIEHEAANPSDSLRVVLIFDVWHPDLSLVEREAVAAIVANDRSPAEL